MRHKHTQREGSEERRGKGRREGEKKGEMEKERMFTIMIILDRGICEFICVQAVSSLWLLMVPHH